MKAQEPSRTAPLSKEAQFYNSRWNSGACLYDYHSFHYHFLYIACYLRRTGNKIETFATVWARGVTHFSKKTGDFLRTLSLNIGVDKLIQSLSSAQTSLNILRGTNKYQIDI